MVVVVVQLGWKNLQLAVEIMNDHQGRMSIGPMCGSGHALGEGCRYGLVGAGVGLSDGLRWLSSSSGGIKVGAGTGYLAGLLGVCHELNAIVCSIVGAPDMCSMEAIEHLTWAAPLDE